MPDSARFAEVATLSPLKGDFLPFYPHALGVHVPPIRQRLMDDASKD